MFIGVGCFRGPSFKDIDLFDVGSKAVETFVSFTLDAIMFERKVGFYECIGEGTVDVIRFDEGTVGVSSQRLDAVRALDFAQIFLNFIRDRPIVGFFVDFCRRFRVVCREDEGLKFLRNVT